MEQNTPEIKQLIGEYSYLFWYTPENKKEELSHELLVETMLNYGNLEAVKKLFAVMGTKKVAEVFFGMQGRKKMNYFPEIYNFFSLYFNKHA
jgi:hypothetical protein